MYAYKQFLVAGICPFCGRDLSIHIGNIDNKVKHVCVDCQHSLTIVPNRAMFAEIFGPESKRGIGDILPSGAHCCGF